jgi:signal peptidase I
MRRGTALLGLTVLLAGCGKANSKTVVLVVPTTPSSQAPFRSLYRVPSESMAPTLTVGTRVVVRPSAPKVGDIVVFHPPEGAEQEECGPTPHVVRLGGAACSEPLPTRSVVKFVKRIVAGPGDEIYVSEGHVYRKAVGTSTFAREPDSYIRACGMSPECNFPDLIRIPADHWFMLGDNRGESDDSRFWGPVPTSWIVGVVQLTTQAGTEE